MMPGRIGKTPQVLRRSRTRLSMVVVACTWVTAEGIRYAEYSARCEGQTRVSGADPRPQSKEHMTRTGASTAGIDCNGNGIPDPEDIMNCSANAACDDCNINDVPDECDISGGTSTDNDADGIPDECVFFDQGGADVDWSTPENWGGDEVPNNLDLIDDESTTIDAFGVNLDLKVQIDSLRLRDGTTLNVTGLLDEDLFVKESGGILITSKTSMQSRLLLGEGRKIEVMPGTLEVASGGILELAQPPARGGSGHTVIAAGDVSPPPLLVAGSIRVASKCGEPIAGEMNLTGAMITHVYGDFVIDGSEDCVVCAFCVAARGPGSFAIAGGETPPIVRVKDNAVLEIGGNLVLRGGCQLIHTSSSPIEVSGNFINESICPECFDLSGGIIFQPPEFAVAANVANPVQDIEVSGRDLGPIPDGFNTNFAIRKLEVAPSTLVNFVNHFSNTGSIGNEALYVNSLIFRNGSTVTISDCRLYYHELIDEGATIVLTGNGALVRVSAQVAIPAVSEWGVVLATLGFAIAGTIVVRRSSKGLVTPR